MYVSDGVAKQWLSKYGGGDKLHNVQNAGHLESWYGNRIRNDKPASVNDGPGMVIWLRDRMQVTTSARICEKWLHTAKIR